MITKHGRTRHIGRFKSKIAAARAYDMAAIQTFGKYANLNFKNRAA